VVTVTDGDGWAMRSERMTFGWVVNPLSGVAREKVTVAGLADGEYDVHLYRTWRGLYLEPVAAKSDGGKLTFEVPELVPKGGRAQNIGNDVAFQIVKRGTALKTE
jgi:hypothetical protein